MPLSGARRGPAEEVGGATALMDVGSMEGLQAQSRPGGSMPPPPNSDAQPTSVFEPNQLDELVGKATNDAPPPPARAPSTALVQSARSRFTPTLRSADFEAFPELAAPTRWPLLLGVAIFGGGLGAFVMLRPPAAGLVKDPTLVELEIRADPPSAMFRIDGEALAGNPHRSARKRGAQRQSLTIEAPGHTPQKLELVLDSSTTIDVALQVSAQPAPK